MDWQTVSSLATARGTLVLAVATVSRYSVLPTSDDGWYSQAARHWDVDRPAPRG